eukprot:1770138-Rhodomonas_salina.1
MTFRNPVPPSTRCFWSLGNGRYGPSVCCYAFATRCPVLTWRMLLPGALISATGKPPPSVLRMLSSGMLLRLRYEKSGTERAYGATADPVATLAIFHTLDVNPTLYMLVFGESVLNDAVAGTQLR